MQGELELKQSTYSVNFTNHFRDRKDLSPIEKYVHMDLVSRAGQKQYTWISTENLAKELSMSKPTLTKILKNLEKKGGLYICKRYDKTTKGQKTNRIYVIETNYYSGEFELEHIKSLKLMYPDKVIYE